MQRNTKLFQIFTGTAIVLSLVMASATANADRLQTKGLAEGQTIAVFDRPGQRGQRIDTLGHRARNIQWNCQGRHTPNGPRIKITAGQKQGWINANRVEQHRQSDNNCRGDQRTRGIVVATAPPPPPPPPAPTPNPNSIRELTCTGTENANINVRIFPNRAAIKLGRNAERKRFNEVAEARAGRKRVIVLANNRLLLITPRKSFLLIGRQNGNSKLHGLNCTRN